MAQAPLEKSVPRFSQELLLLDGGACIEELWHLFQQSSTDEII